MTIFLIDTNVFSKIFKGNAAVKTYVENLHSVICTTIYIENIQGSKSNQEKRFIKKYLDNFAFLPIDTDISNLAVELIAASAIENDLTILTYNVSDFKFIDGLKWQKPAI